MLFTVKLWTALYIKCLEIMDIPIIWRESTVKVVYKGNGPQNTPDSSYRGITFECAPFKILNNILLGKIHDRVMTVRPREHYGFIPRRSTTQAIGHMLQYISEALSKPKGHAYAIFVDYKQAFDGVNRSRVLEELHTVLGAGSQIFKLIACIFRENTIRIHDGLTQSQGIQQTNGILQEDPISSLIFNVLTHDVIPRIQTEEVRI
jgi:Reverse transcriptase (RNA-dependent DNA polymerase).